jgi:hypothetical protein
MRACDIIRLCGETREQDRDTILIHNSLRTQPRKARWTIPFHLARSGTFTEHHQSADNSQHFTSHTRAVGFMVIKAIASLRKVEQHSEDVGP